MTMQKQFTPSDHLQAYRDCIAQYHSLTEELSEELMNKKPGADRWSVADISEHLVASADVYLPPMQERAKEAGDIGDSEPTFTHGVMMRLTCWMLEPPYRLKMGTFRDLEPAESHFAKESVVERFLDRQHLFLSFIETFGNRPLDQLIIRSPELKLVSMNVSEALAFLAAHQRRHLWQIEQTLETISG